MSPGSRVAGSTHSWPAVNARVTVSVGVRESEPDVQVASRVEDVADDAIVIAAPRFAGDMHWVAPGREVVLTWGSDRGGCFQRLEIVGLERSPVPCWRLSPVSPVHTEQRRRFVRAALTAPALLVPEPAEEPGGVKAAPGGADAEGAPAPPAPVPVRFIDLSEGGARVVLPAAAGLRAGALARLRADIDGVELDQPATVLRTRPAATEGALEAVLDFVEPVRHADHLRRYVLRLQIENRRKGVR